MGARGVGRTLFACQNDGARLVKEAKSILRKRSHETLGPSWYASGALCLIGIVPQQVSARVGVRASASITQSSNRDPRPAFTGRSIGGHAEANFHFGVHVSTLDDGRMLASHANQPIPTDNANGRYGASRAVPAAGPKGPLWALIADLRRKACQRARRRNTLVELKFRSVRPAPRPDSGECGRTRSHPGRGCSRR